jgi:multisubunit Na+/H+ antiporter MnhF subunit
MADRVIALDLLLVTLMTAIVVDAVATGDAVLFNVLAVIAIIGFTATVAVARFMDRSR